MPLTNLVTGIQLIVNSIGDAVVAADLNGKIIYYNPVAKELLGVDAPEALAPEWINYFGVFEEDKITLFETENIPLVRAVHGLESDNVIQFIRNQNRPAGIFISVTGRPIYDADAKLIGGVVVIRDISAERKAKEEIKKANRLLVEKNIELQAVNAELESFSYSVSHDLRAPLRSIIGFSDILLKKFSDNFNAEGLDYLTRIKDSGDKLGQLIDGLLDLSRLSRGELNRAIVNLSEISKVIISDLKIQEPDRKVDVQIAENLTGMADQRLIRPLLQNLISNAWKFSSKNPAAQIVIGSQTGDNGSTVFFVKDNGAGFNSKYADKLFKIFQRLHSLKEFDGTGIGLATVQRIISKHGGRIWAEGQPGVGATFYFTLS